ncbi:protein disulfide-isomerase [Sarracenia purpurea var. burkii]
MKLRESERQQRSRRTSGDASQPQIPVQGEKSCEHELRKMTRQSQICWTSGTLALIVLSSVSMAEDVVISTEDNFEKEVGHGRGAPVDLCARGHCKKLTPEYDKLGHCEEVCFPAR